MPRRTRPGQGAPTRRRLLKAVGVAAAGAVAARFAVPRLLRAGPVQPVQGEAERWVAALHEGIDRSRMWDVHVHLLGRGDGGTGCRVDQAMLSHLNPLERLRYEIYLAAAGVGDAEDVDAAYVARLLELARQANGAGRLVLLPLDEAVDESGQVIDGRVPFFTPNEYALRVAAEHEPFEAACSIHPYRQDAVDRLDAAVEGGARLVKWLPAVQGIDPMSELCDPFYERLAELGTPLLTHAGHEAAMHGEQQDLGNPLRLVRPLDAGVRVVVAHAASLGTDLDTDAPPESRTRVPSWELLLRLMDEPRWERQLFADLSAVTQFNRCGEPLRALLRRPELHHRLVNGSDYPLPAVNPLISTWRLQQAGYLGSRERAFCNTVYEANPLLFDFVVKRSLALQEGGRTLRLAPTVFETSWLFS